MKRFTFKAAVSLLFTFLVCILPGAVCAQNPKMIDSFDQEENGIKYSSFHGETVLTQEGYGIFYETADATLSRVTLKESDKALRIQYDLPPLGYGDNWISVRKDFASAFDLTEYDGLDST